MTVSLTAELGNEEGQHTGNATEEQRGHAERPTAPSLQQKWKQQRGSFWQTREKLRQIDIYTETSHTEADPIISERRRKTVKEKNTLKQSFT